MTAKVAKPETTPRRVAVLVVNDHEAQRYALAHTLEHAGYTVHTAANGAEALVQAALRPDVVVLDVGLPDINGFDVCRLLKSCPETAHIPVVFLSATFQSGSSRSQGDMAGASAYLFHPVDTPTLLAVVQGAVARARALTA